MPYNIYALLDPRDDSIRYIGMTRDLKDRVSRHMANIEHASPEKHAWIADLKAHGLECVPWELEQVSSKKDAERREQWWIRYCLSGGEPLLNKESPHVTHRMGRNSTNEQFLQLIAAWKETGVCPWKDETQMRYYLKKKHGIVI